MFKSTTFTFLAAAAFVAGASAQQRLPVPSVDYQAERLVESSAGTFSGHVYFSTDKERTETEMGGFQSVTIVRRDRNVVWNLMPAQRMVRETDLKSARDMKPPAGEDVRISVVGNETVEGVATTKYKLIAKDGAAGGFMWFSREGIAVKMDLLQKEDGKASRMTVTLRNLQVGPQDPQVFEVPEGYSKMPGFKSMFGSMTPDTVKSLFGR
jgi:outer membrane lipoprotein-sorting protein